MAKRTKRLTADDSSAQAWLVVAVVLTVLATFIPFGEFLLYPFKLFQTFIHETLHAAAAVVTGGEVVGMNVSWDTSGLTRTRGGWNVVISSAGYAGSALIGAILLLLARRSRRAPATLLVVGALTVAATLVFAGYGSSFLTILGFGLGASLVAFGHACKTDDRPGDKYTAIGGFIILGVVGYLAFTGGLLTWTVGLAVGLAAIAVGAWAPRWLAHGSLMFLAVQTSLDSLRGINAMLGAGGHVDAANMAAATGVPAIVWAALWTILSLLFVGGALFLFWRDEH